MKQGAFFSQLLDTVEKGETSNATSEDHDMDLFRFETILVEAD